MPCFWTDSKNRLGDGFDVGEDGGFFAGTTEAGWRDDDGLVDAGLGWFWRLRLAQSGFSFVEFHLPSRKITLSPVAELLAAGAVRRGDLGLGRDGAELRMDDDFVDGRSRNAVGVVRLPGEVQAGDLESVEEQAGAARVEIVGGDALENQADGGLDCGPVFGQWQLEGGLAVARGGGRAAASGVVVVAELLVAEADGATAASIVEDVAALEPFGLFGCGGIRH